ncbi:uncharacterized protein LOC142563668 [Dermacentor variabilis]|uniref:uncharacterized protein LOC142563668 n=1 Tax=Dermacentor variabilis TaxID=34621 RepID=UPI003F5BBA31
MKLGFPVPVLLLTGMLIATITDATVGNKSPLISSRDASPCLKKGWRYGGDIKPWYYYDSQTEKCVKVEDSAVSRADLSPVINAFQSEYDCKKNACFLICMGVKRRQFSAPA